MITEFVIGLFVSFASWLISLLPSWSTPDWATSISTQLTAIVGYASHLNKWFPLGAIALVATAVIAAYGVALLVRLGRIVLSLFTAGGGSAA